MYGALFSIVAFLLSFTAISVGGWALLLIWPAISFMIVALGYLYFGAAVFGKTSSGVISPLNQLLLFPFLVFTWSIWHCLRLIKHEPAYHQLTPHIFIGRRLLSHELPPGIDHIVDLTCEFNESSRMRFMSYHSFPILDGSIPSQSQILQWVRQISSLTGNMYIHCAEGHGRTGLVAGLLLIRIGHSHSADESINYIQSIRPLVRLGKSQRALLQACQDTVKY